MPNVDYRKGQTATGTQDVNVINEVNIRDLSCDRDHPDICDRANRILGIISTITDPVNISDNCARLLGQICVSGAAIDPRQIRNLVFANDKVDVSGSNVNATISGTPDVNITDNCARLLGQICYAGSAIDPRAIRALTFLTDKVDVSGSSITASISGTPTVDEIDRCTRQLGTLCSGGIPIDPRQIRNLVFITDKVDVSGSTVTTASGSVATIDDAFMEMRLMADALKDLPLTVEASTSRIRTNVETIGGLDAKSTLLNDISDINWATSIRSQII